MTSKDKLAQELLDGRYIATLATLNDNGTVHLTAVWYLWNRDAFFIATASTSQKARNAKARPQASLMVDVRRAGGERGVTVSGPAELITGEQARSIVARIHSRYMSEAAITDPQVGPILASLDDVVIRLKPKKWTWWDMRALDAQVFAGRLTGTPGYLLPLD